MNDFGPPLVAIGVALLLVPVAEMVGSLGYFLLGFSFVTVGGMVAFLPDSAALVGDVGRAGANNCPDCGSPNEPDAEACDYCGAAL